MPRRSADPLILISSSSSSEEEGERCGGIMDVQHSAAASGSGKKGDGVTKSKKRKVENGAAPSEDDRRGREESGPETKAKPKPWPKKKKNKKEEEGETKFPSSSGDAEETVAPRGELAVTSVIFALPASRLNRPPEDGGDVRGNGAKSMDPVRKEKRKQKKGPGTAVSREGNVKKTKTKRKNKEDKIEEDTEKKGSSSSSQAGDVVATSDGVGRPSPTCSFPMSRVKRLIAGSEVGSRKVGVRTSLDSVFLINKASEFFLELFAQDAYAHAAQDHKRALFYKHLSSTVYDMKRYEFLSDFVPEKVRAEDALKALAEQQ